MKKNLIIVLLTVLFVQCRTVSSESRVISDVLPMAPNYSDNDQWYITDRQADADIFYIISTETGDYRLPGGITCHYADTHRDSTRHPLLGEMAGVDQLVSGSLNFFSPYYRQCSLQSFTSDSLTQARMPVATGDVRQAFTYYLTHLNGGRPFVLVGYSQGAMIMLDLIKEMDDAAYSRMIAAYAIGIAISREQLDKCPHIVAAQGADDTGVTICYNSVRTPDCAMNGWEYSAVAINPVNWRTDATPTRLITEPSPSIPLDQQRKDTISVHLDTTSGLLLVDGFTGTDYILPLIGKEGNYHSREIWLYRDQLRDNIAQRTNSYLKITKY